MELLHSQFSGDPCHSFRRLLVGHPPSLLQEPNRLLPFARPHHYIQPHLPFGVDSRSGGMQPLHTDLPVRDAAEENPPLVVRVASLLVLDEIIDDGVDVVRLELVPEFWILGFDRFPGVAVVFSGSVEADTLVPCDVGEHEGDMCCFRRGNLAGMAKQTFRHLLHDLRQLERLGSHGRVISSLSSACTGDPDLLHLLRQEQRQRRCLLNLTCSDGASLLPLVLASSPTWYQGSGRSPLGSSSLSDNRHAPDHRR